MTVKRVVPDLAVDGVAASRDFYVGLLGFEVAMDLGAVVTLVSPANPTAQLTLQNGSSPNLTIEVDDVDAVHRIALERGDDVVYPLTDEDWGVRRFFVRDPSGVVVNVMAHTT